MPGYAADFEEAGNKFHAEVFLLQGVHTMSTAVEHAGHLVTTDESSDTTLMTNTPARLLADIHALAHEITSRAAEIEAGRRIPIDLVEALRSIGVFRTFVPRSHGGLELDLPAAVDIIRALGKIDGSVGWTAMVAGNGAVQHAVVQSRHYVNAGKLLLSCHRH